MLTNKDILDLTTFFNADAPVRVGVYISKQINSENKFELNLSTEDSFMLVTYNAKTLSRAAFLKKLAKDCAKLVARDVMDYAQYKGKSLFGAMTDAGTKKRWFDHVNKATF